MIRIYSFSYFILALVCLTQINAINIPFCGSCSQYLNQNQCQNYNCTWTSSNNSCSGQTNLTIVYDNTDLLGNSSCASRSQQTCNGLGNETIGAACYWDTTCKNQSILTSCYGITNYNACYAILSCGWNATNNTCVNDACELYPQQDCVGSIVKPDNGVIYCVWNNTQNTCVSGQISNYTTQQDCSTGVYSGFTHTWNQAKNTCQACSDSLNSGSLPTSSTGSSNGYMLGSLFIFALGLLL